jgi:uncharacterized protein (DUF2141 family)
MKVIFTFLIIWATTGIYAGENEPKGKVVVTVSGIQNNEGIMMVALFGEHDKFLKEPSFWKEIPVSSQSDIEVTFTGIPYGVYAASIYHDLNKNGELDSNMFMIPKEPIGFSNDYFPKFGPPKFKNASFEINGPTTTLSVALKTY